MPSENPAPLTVIVTKPNGSVFLLHATDDADASRYVVDVESRGWSAEVDRGAKPANQNALTGQSLRPASRRPHGGA